MQNISLLRGKMGLVIFFMHYHRHTKNILYEDVANELMDEMETDPRRMTDYTLETGLGGILLYVLAHCEMVSEQSQQYPFDTTYISGLIRKKYQSSTERRDEIRKKYHISNIEKLVLFVGRIDPIKGITPLLSCFDKVVTEYPNCRIVLIGDGDISNSIKVVRHVQSKITFTGRLDRKTLYEWYQIADIAVFPSFYEECSYVGIEMLMHGLPVVASDGYSVKNMFNDNNAVIASIEDDYKTDKFAKNLIHSILALLKSEKLLSLKRHQALEAYNKFV